MSHIWKKIGKKNYRPEINTLAHCIEGCTFTLVWGEEGGMGSRVKVFDFLPCDNSHPCPPS